MGKELSMQKKKTWAAFSRYIRTRDCIKTTGSAEHGRCYTCGQVFPFNKLQAGHAVSGRNNSVLFDEEIVKAQCVGCNMFGGGKYSIFIHRLISENSIDWFGAKIEQSNKMVKFTVNDLKELEKKFKVLTDVLLGQG